MLYKIIYNESIFLYIFLFHISLLYYFMDLTDNSEIFLCFFAITFILLFHIFYFMLLSDYCLTLHECNVQLYITSQLFTFNLIYFIIIHLADYCLSYFSLLFLCYFNLIYCFNYILLLLHVACRAFG